MGARQERKSESVGGSGAAVGGADVQQTARAGISGGGGGGAMPFGGQIQGAFGHHDISHVNAHTGQAAQKANAAMGSSAYTSGSHVAFGGTPDLHTAAHEAAHVVQQSRGISLAGGVGRAGDAHERQADAAADAVVAGRSAAGILDRGGGGGGGSAGGMQVQHKKTKLKKGTELSKSKAGTKQSKEDYVELMSSDDDTRVGRIHDLLTTKSEKGNQLFYHLEMLMSGDNKNLAQTYQTKHNLHLKNQIGSTLTNPYQVGYLWSILDNGEPQLEDKLRMALGLVTGSASDSKGVLKLFEDADDQEKLRVWGAMEAQLRAGLKEKTSRIEQQVRTIELGERLTQSGQKGSHLGNRRMFIQKDEELAALIRSCVGKLAMKRDKLKEVLPEWASKQDEPTRQWVTRPGSLFRQTMAEQHKGGMGKVRKALLFTDSDIEYACDMVKKAQPVGDWFFQDDEDTSQMPEKQKKKREKKQKEEGGQLGELESYMDRKERDNSKSKIGQGVAGYRWETLKERLDDMDNNQKDAYLRTFLSSTEQAEWDDESTVTGRLKDLRQQALDALNAKLKSMGMEGLKATGLRKKIIDSFRYGATSNTHHGMSTYQRIKALTDEKLPRSEVSFGKKVMTLMRKLRGNELAFVRSDTELLRTIQKMSAPKYWEMVELFLGLKSGSGDRSSGNVNRDLLGMHNKSGGAKYELDEAQQLGVDEAELNPSHWAVMLTSCLKDSSQRRVSEVNSIVTRSYMAGLRREKMIERGQSEEQSGTRTLKAMSAGRFQKRVWEQLSSGARKLLIGGNTDPYKNAREALQNGTRPTVDQQVDDLKYVNQMKRLSGNDADPGKFMALFEDLSGRAFLDEWSNIEDWREQKKQWQAAKDAGNDQQKELLEQQMQDFVLDIRDDRRELVIGMFSQKDIVSIQSKLRGKLTDAMAGDSEVVEYLREVELDNDELSRARTKNLALLDEQKQRSTGAQHNTFLGTGKKSGLKNPLSGQTLIGASSTSAQVKESTGIVLGRTRKAQTELQGGKDRGEVVKDNAKGIEKAQKELSERAKVFEELQKKYNKFVKMIVKGLAAAVAAAAMGVIMVATGGAAIPGLAAAMVAMKTLIKTSIVKLVERALEGDAFNTTAAITDVAFSTFAAAAGGVVSEFGGGEMLSSLGIDMLAPKDPGEAAAISFATKGLKLGTKQFIKAGLDELRSTETNPKARLMVMSSMAGTILTMGSRIGNAAYQKFAEDFEKDPSQNQIAKKAVGTTGQGIAKLTKKVPLIWDKLEELWAPEPGEHGDDREDDMSDFVPDAIERGESTLKEMEDEGSDLLQTERYVELRDKVNKLKADYATWQDEQKSNEGESGEMESAKSSNSGLIGLAVEIHELVDEGK